MELKFTNVMEDKEITLTTDQMKLLLLEEKIELKALFVSNSKELLYIELNFIGYEIISDTLYAETNDAKSTCELLYHFSGKKGFSVASLHSDSEIYENLLSLMKPKIKPYDNNLNMPISSVIEDDGILNYFDINGKEDDVLSWPLDQPKKRGKNK